MSTEPRNAPSPIPGGLRARWRWGGSGSGPAVFALSEARWRTGRPGHRASRPIRSRCAAPSCDSRARAAPGRPASPRSSTTSRGRSTGTPTGLLVVAYGFHTYGLEVDSGEAPLGPPVGDAARSPCFGSPRLAHVIVQSELETFAIEPDGTVAWRVAHSDVVTAADLLGGRLVLTSFDGQVSALDPATGRSRRLTGRADCGRTVDNPRRSPRRRWTNRIDRPGGDPYRSTKPGEAERH